jgi:hypothetical protein
MRNYGKISRALGPLAIASALAFGAALVAAGPVRADDSSQLPDVTKQVQDMQNKLAQLTARGQLGRSGKLAALADCGYGPTQQVFSNWGDSASYALAPGGDLSDTIGWTLKNTQLSTDHDPYTDGSGSLLFAKGDAEAITPVTCVNLDNPSMRVFVADQGGNGKAHLDVTLVYEGLDGGSQKLTVARLMVGDKWQPSVVIPIPVGVLAAGNANGWVPVAFDFKVKGLQKDETFSLDGIWVDPCVSR